MRNEHLAFTHKGGVDTLSESLGIAKERAKELINMVNTAITNDRKKVKGEQSNVDGLIAEFSTLAETPQELAFMSYLIGQYVMRTAMSRRSMGGFMMADMGHVCDENCKGRHEKRHPLEEILEGVFGRRATVIDLGEIFAQRRG